jgi:hypothetical protein
VIIGTDYKMMSIGGPEDAVHRGRGEGKMLFYLGFEPEIAEASRKSSK